MKKLFAVLVCLLTINMSMVANDDIPITVDKLPQVSQDFIKQYFPSQKISYAKLEKEFFGKKYEVIFVDGSKVEFNSDGSWKEVKCKYSVVPEGIVPNQIITYVNTNFPDAKVVKIERKSYKYEVKLSNGFELDFDQNFALTKLDD